MRYFLGTGGGERIEIVIDSGDEIAKNELKTLVFPIIRRIVSDASDRAQGKTPKKKPCGCGGSE
jgi:hypothetical protein